MNKDFQHNEGLTISEDGRGDGEYLLDVYNWDKMKHYKYELRHR